ncbi:MAG TPA: MoxR family ATPase [Kofleriaceae bacterium]|jgi:MoxR-like ATPase|nr:MoxR family ATPase [Kofleriaceae bacterium]
MARRTESTAQPLPFPATAPHALFQHPPRPTGSPPEIATIQHAVQEAGGWVEPLRAEVGRVLVGQHALVDRLIVALLAGGHVLLEGLPGLAKTLALKTLAQVIDTGFQRIQFTPDMLPADIVGTLIYNPRDGHFETKRGPLFSNLILADEINRAPAKVQSALLEAMQERQVTLGDTTHALPSPFMVMATQNPIEQEGTYPLPEAQVDRFLLKVVVTYPTPDEELAILDAMATSAPRLDARPVLAAERLLDARRVVDSIYVDDKVRRYIVSLVVATRDPAAFGLDLAPLIRYGASPRATIALTLCAKAWAFMHGRGYVTPQDVKAIATDVLRHRIAVTYEAEAERTTSEQIVERVLAQVAIP